MPLRVLPFSGPGKESNPTPPAPDATTDGG